MVFILNAKVRERLYSGCTLDSDRVTVNMVAIQLNRIYRDTSNSATAIVVADDVVAACKERHGNKCNDQSHMLHILYSLEMKRLREH